MNGLDHASADASSVTRIESPRIPLMSFSTKVPVSTLDSMDESNIRTNPFGQRSVVGTITLLKNCVVIWVGWGESEEVRNGHDKTKIYLQSVLGTGKPPQGHCTVVMPRATSYKGAFSAGPKDLPCSTIIGGGSTDAQMLATQMASRLSAKLSMAVFVSCQLTNEISSHSDESSSIPPLAAAAAEKEVIKVIKSELAAQICK